MRARRALATRLRIAAVLCAAGAMGLAATPGLAKKEPLTPCRPGRYLLAGTSLGSGATPAAADALVFGPAGVELPGVCGPVRITSLRARRNGTTLLRAAWPAGACQGLAGRVRLSATLAEACASLTGSLRAKRVKRRLQARLSTCGDGRTDAGAGEQCEPPSGVGCNASCQLVPATTTTIVTPTTTSMAITSTTTTTLTPRLDVWKPATVPYDPACGGCRRLGMITRMPHLDGDLVIDANPAVDDPIAQWGDCVQSVLDCLQPAGDLGECVQRSSCPAACRSLFAERAAGVAPSPRLAAIFDEVFLARAAPCRPAEEVRP